MEINLEQNGVCTVRVKGNFSQEEVARKYRQLLNELKSSVHFPGFRPGKAPDSVILARFGDALWDELARRMISEVLEDAEKKDERIKNDAIYVGEPKFEKPDPGKPFAVEIDVEFLPYVELKKYSDFELVRPRVEISQEDIDREIEAFRIRNARLEPQQRAVQKNDYVEVDITMGDEQPVLHLIPLDDPEFAQFFGELIGKSAGEQLVMERQFPQNFPDRRLRGFSGKLNIIIKNVYEQKIPELNSEFFRSMGKPDGYSLDDFRKEVEAFLSSRMSIQSREELREQVITKLVEENPVEIPTHYLESRIDNYVRNRFSIKNTDSDSVRKLKDSVRNKVTRDVEFEFIAKKIAENEKIEVSEIEIRDNLKKLAISMGVDPKSTDKLGEGDTLYELVRQSVLNEKVADFVLSRCKIVDLNTIRTPELQNKLSSDESSGVKNGTGKYDEK